MGWRHENENNGHGTVDRMGKQDWDRVGHWGRMKLGRWDRVVGIGMTGWNGWMG